MAEQSASQVLIYDTDGGNPYGRELGALLATSFPVRALVPVQTEWIPQDLPTRRILPSNNPATLVAQIWRQIVGLTVVAWNGIFRETTIVVVMTRSWYDELALAFLGKLGARIAVIAHDPMPKVPLSGIRKVSRRMLWNAALSVLVHSNDLASQAKAQGAKMVRVVPHLPFLQYAAWTHTFAPDERATSGCRLLVLGQMRPDKGLDRLPDVISHIPDNVRARISIAFAGQGDCADIIAKLKTLVPVARSPEARRLSDLEIARELARSDILLAPYPLVSASGTVVLALCRGLGVIAYDTGALADVINSDGLVPLGNEREFALRIEAALKADVGRPKHSLDAWRDSSLAAWLEAIGL